MKLYDLPGAWRWLLLPAALLVVVGAGDAPVWAQRSAATLAGAGRGPFSITTQSPLQIFRLAYLHQAPVTGPAGSVRALGAATWANTWAFEPLDHVIDRETLQLNALAEYAITGRLAASLRYTNVYVDGGTLDGAVEQVHGLLGRDRDYRDRVGRDEVHAARLSEERTVEGPLDGSRPGWYARAPVASLRWALRERERVLPLVAQVSLSLPRFERETTLQEPTGRDGAVGLAGAYRITPRWSTTASVAHVEMRPGALPGKGAPRTVQRSTLLATDYALSRRTALVAQWLHETAVAEGTESKLDVPAQDVVLGAKWRLGQAVELELALMENVIEHSNNADVALHLAVWARLR